VAACDAGADRPVRIGLPQWAGFEPAVLARDQGWLGDQPIELVDFLTLNEAARAYRHGTIDAIATTLDNALQLADGDGSQRVVLVLDQSHGADALVARRPVTTLEGLRGRRIGVDPGALGRYMLVSALERAGLGLGDVTVVPLDYSAHERALAAGRVDAVVTLDPARGRLLGRGATELFSSADIPGEIVDVLVADTALLRDRRRELEAFAAAWFRARDAVLRDPDRWAAALARRQGTTAEELTAAFGVLRFPDRTANAALLGSDTSSLRAAARRLDGVMRRHGMLADGSSVARLFDPVLVRPR